MSITCPDCGAVAGYGRELPHKSDCPVIVAPARKAMFFGANLVREIVSAIDQLTGHVEIDEA